MATVKRKTGIEAGIAPLKATYESEWADQEHAQFIFSRRGMVKKSINLVFQENDRYMVLLPDFQKRKL